MTEKMETSWKMEKYWTKQRHKTILLFSFEHNSFENLFHNKINNHLEKNQINDQLQNSPGFSLNFQLYCWPWSIHYVSISTKHVNKKYNIPL